MKHPSNNYTFDGKTYTLSWIKTDDIEKYHPITQVYGVIFNGRNEILVCKQMSKHSWHLPGGHIEDGEDYKQALEREAIEEVDVRIKDINPIGVQKVTMPDNPDFVPGYQLRCIATVQDVLPQTIDPDSQTQWERMFVPSKQIKEYIKWDTSGDAMLDDAVEAYYGSKI